MNYLGISEGKHGALNVCMHDIIIGLYKLIYEFYAN
jgi:hypothetical protein